VALSRGQGIEADRDEAAKWFEKSHQQGHLDGTLNLASAYLAGYGVTKSQSKAIILFKQAAAKGSVEAESMLGRIYANDKNYREAERWLKKAAEHGDFLVSRFYLDTRIRRFYLCSSACICGYNNFADLLTAALRRVLRG
jgi:TPR repeat protein